VDRGGLGGRGHGREHRAHAGPHARARPLGR
jgi:hypothetical protein